MTEKVEVPKELLEKVLDRVDELESRLSEYRNENEHDKATIRQQVNQVTEKANAQSSQSPQNDENADESGPATPMERLIRMGENAVTKTLTPSDRRAKAIAEQFGRWSSRAPNGLVIKENLKTLLETATGETLAWEQVYRACRNLADLTKGAIAFKKHDRHGWILVSQPDDHRSQSLLAAAG